MRNHQRLFAAAVVVLSLLAIAAPALAGEGKAVNVNTATVAEFQLLPRIGPAVAAPRRGGAAATRARTNPRP